MSLRVLNNSIKVITFHTLSNQLPPFQITWRTKWTFDCSWKGSRTKVVLPASNRGFISLPSKERRRAVWCLDGCSNHTCTLMTPSLQGPRAGLEDIIPFLLSAVKGSSSRPLISENRPFKRQTQTLKEESIWREQRATTPKADQHMSGIPGSWWQPKHQASQHLCPRSGWERPE